MSDSFTQASLKSHSALSDLVAPHPPMGQSGECFTATLNDPRDNFRLTSVGTKNFDCFAFEAQDKIEGQEDGVKPACLMQELCQPHVQ